MKSTRQYSYKSSKEIYDQLLVIVLLQKLIIIYDDTSYVYYQSKESCYICIISSTICKFSGIYQFWDAHTLIVQISLQIPHFCKYRHWSYYFSQAFYIIYIYNINRC